ncbi:DUF6531 domain-containing protein, partial [Photobacterium nomapromontoriensis]|uniref:DUF6531 domain-containing protein n=1 Tax=Photobacterium nomapromontoriensis TaxID=2910237 RepID=UPI003D10B8F6
MDGLRLLQLKANDGKAYQFALAKNANPKNIPIRFDTLQLARLHIDKFARLRAAPGGDLLAVLGLLDFSAENKARTVGHSALNQAKETLAKAIFDKTLSVYEVPEVDPMILHQPTFIEQVVSTKKKATTQGGREETVPVGDDSIADSPTAASPDEMAYCGDPVSMATGEEILTLTDIHLTGSASIRWERLYRSSLSQQNVGLGYGWRSNFHFELTPIKRADDGVTQWHFVDHQGSVLVFDDVAAGAVSYQLTAGASLFHDPRGSYRVTLNDGRQLRFGYHHTRWVLERLRENETLQYQLSYSSAGRLVHIAANGCQQLELRYDRGGNLIEVQSPACEEASSSPGARRDRNTEQVLAHYHYNANHDLCKASNRQQQVETYLYSDHLLVQRTRPSGFSHYFEWQGKGPTARCRAQWGDEGNYHYRFEYDLDNHTAVSTDSLGNQWQFEHNAQGRLLCKVSPLGHRWQYHYDARSRKIAEISPDGTATHYRYNRYGQLHEEQAPDGAITRYCYNRLGQMILIVDSENREWRNDYNSFGRLLSQHSPGGLEKHYQYDRHGRITHITQSDGRHLRYWWNTKGLLAAVQDGESITRYSYDSLGEINGMISHDGWVTQYRRERTGQIVEIIQHSQSQPDQVRQQYIEYDWAGRPTTFTDAIGRCNSFIYEGLAQPTKHIRPDGSWLAFEYDSERNLTGIERSDGGRYQLAYDSEERVSRTIGFDGRTQQYQYDGQGQLISLAEQGERFIKLRRDECGRVLEQRSSVAGTTHSNHFQYDKLGRLR